MRRPIIKLPCNDRLEHGMRFYSSLQEEVNINSLGNVYPKGSSCLNNRVIKRLNWKDHSKKFVRLTMATVVGVSMISRTVCMIDSS